MEILFSQVFAQTDESNYSCRQTALLQQDELELRDAQSSHVLINIIHLTFKGNTNGSQVRWDYRG